ncbi:MAG: phage tail tape measure protein [Muribaculum sp.]|nr:phage tail tape measure protein [Muribaculum sp.]
MSGIRDTATVTLNVNGAQAKQMMADIEAKIKQTEATIDNLKKSMADPKDIEKAKKELKTYQKQLEEMRSATEGVDRALSNIDLATPRQLEKALRTLNRQLKDMVPGSDVWDSHCEKIQELKARLRELREQTEEQQSAWESFMEWSQGAWPALDLLKGWYDDIVSGLREYVDAYADMEQEMANVRKFTGMTEEQVVSLNEHFRQIDTRTSREQLNLLAQEAGRLGKTSEEDVLGFVRAADKINVALDDLGEGATLTLSKLTGIFGDEQRYGTEQSLLKVGSVINELSQNCSASAPYIAHFTERMGGVGSQAKMTIPQIMGFAAVLDTNAQALEASSTALSQIIVRLYQDPAKYAKVAGLDAQEFATLMREDANAALILFLETLQKAGGMDQLSPMFKDMGENGSRAIAALSTLATHIDQVKAQQEAANTAFREGTSIDNEFAVQNNTVQASLDKCKNRANELRVELGEHLYPIMGHFLTTSAAIMRVLITLVRWIAENKGVVISLTAAVAAYIVTVNLAIIKEKAWIAICAVGRAAMLLWTAAVKLGAVAVALFSGNLAKARTAWIAFSAALHASPIGLAVAAITAVVALLATFAVKAAKATNESERLAKAQKKISDAEREAEASCVTELATLEALYKATQDQTLAMDARFRAVDKLQEQYPDYFKNLSKEAILAGDAADAYERLRTNIVRSAKAQARKDLLAETEGDILKVRRERDRKVSEALADVTIPDREQMYYPLGETGKEMYINSPNHPEFIITRRYIEQVRADAAEELAQLEKERELLYDGVARDVLEEVTTSTSDDDGGGGDDTPPKPARFAKEDAWKEQQEALTQISYARGESSYAEHTARMNEIAVQYYNKLLERTDLSENERLTIQAQYWEAVNKQTIAGNKQLIDDENSAYQQTLYAFNENYRLRLERGNLSAREREEVERAHQEAVELAELNHLARLVDMYEDGSAEKLQAQQAYQSAQLKAQQRHHQEYEKQQAEYDKYKEKFFGDNPAEKQQKYDAAFAILQTVYARELAAAGDNADEKLRIEEAFLQAQAALRKQYGLEAEEDTRNSMERAVASSVEWLNSDGGKAITGTISTLASGMSSIFSGLSTMMQAELEIQTAAINKKYDAEISAVQGNSYKVAKLEKKKEAEIAKAKNAANKKMFAMQVIQAVAQTAQNALSAYGSAAAIPVVGYILAPVAAAMAVAAGAIQIAAIKKQQQASEAQGYAEGGFTGKGGKYEPAGIVHKGEWVASQELLANPVARPMIEALDQAQRTNTIGSLRAEDVSRSITANNSLVRIAETDNGSLVMAAVASQMSAAVADLTDRLNEPFYTMNSVTGDYGMKQAQDEYSRLMNNVTPKSKRKSK